jgi:Pyridine nucleotide-disulphide oxidoreductase
MLAQTANRFGTVTGPVRTDMAKVRSRKQVMIEREIAAHLNAYATSGAELIMGSGRFVAPKTIEVRLNDGGTRLLQGDRVFVNVGSHAAIPNVPGLEAAWPLTHIDALELDSQPRHLIVLGGGYTGLELVQAYRRFGSQVTIIEPGRHGPRGCGRRAGNAGYSDHRRDPGSGERHTHRRGWPVRRRAHRHCPHAIRRAEDRGQRHSGGHGAHPKHRGDWVRGGRHRWMRAAISA